MKKIALFIKRYLFILVLCLSQGLLARTFVHPGGIHSMDDLNRMKAKVAAKEHPWIDAWNLLITDPQAQSTWTASPYTNIGGNIIRQAAARDARAAYLNILRWYITGSVANADCAVRICNAWSASINQVANGELYQLPISTFMQAAELLRMYPGWAKADQENFKNMALTYFYQPCHDFLSFCDAHSSWSAPALYSIMGIAVFCDDSTTYDEAANYFKTGAYSGCIMKGIMQPSGQLGEMARDQPHAAIGPAAWSHICQVAWNQGDTSLFSYGNNRLLAGYEYFCKANLNHPVEWIPYTDCSYRWYYMSLSGLCNLNKATPEFELIYNHYAVLKGIPAPFTHKMANLTRISQGDYFGYGTLTFTLDGADSPYPPYPIPAAPANLTATPGASRIYLHWTPPDGDVATGYNVWRSASADGPFTNLATLSDYTGGNYADKTAAPGTTYYYAVSAINQSGAGAKSSVAGAQSIAASATLPIGWARNDIGSYTVAGTASYANVKNKTFVVTGTGSTIGGSSDSYNYTFTRVTGDFTLTVRLSEVNLSDGSNRFGIMFREKLTPGSKMLTLNLQDPYERYTNFGRREIEGGNTSWIEGAQFTSAPCWYRLKRVGNVFTAYHSIDGVNWPIVGSATVSLSTQYYAGLAICGGSTTGSVATALFENVTTEGGGDVAAAPAGLTATPINSSRIRLSWTASPSAAAYIVKRSLSETGPYTTVSTTATSTTFDDINLDANTDYYYVVKSANIKGESLDSIQISAKTKELTLPPAPTGLKATVRNKNVTLNWTPTEEFTTSYNIKRSTISGGPYSVIDTSSLAYYEDKTVENGQLYYYRVSSNNALGESAESLQVSAKPDIGEVAYWPLDETTGLFGVDAWFSRKDTLKTLAKWTAGKVNNGVHMDGTATSYVALPAGLFQTLKDFTISMWVKLDAIDQWCRLFDFGSGTNTYMFVSPRSTDGYMRYAITNTGNSGELKILTKTTLSTGTWTHVAVTQLGTTCILYVNGMEVGRNAQMFLNPSLLGNTKSNYIGKSQWPDPMLKGTVDEFRIYSQALLPSQILMLKNIARQTISFDTISQKKVGDAEFALVASASSGLPLTFETSNSLVAFVTDNFVQIKKVGTADIIATQAGNESYAAALPVMRTVVVGPATGIETPTSEQVLLFPNPVTDFLHIQLGNISSDAILHLYNSRGALLLTKNLLAIDNLIDVRSLDPGLYLAKICDGRNVVNSKFLKIGR